MRILAKKKEFEAELFSGIKSYWGLRFSKPKPIILKGNKKRMDIDMFFCFYPLDIYWIKDNKVVKKARAKPFRVYFGVEADYVLETPIDFIDLKNGEKVRIIK